MHSALAFLPSRLSPPPPHTLAHAHPPTHAETRGAPALGRPRCARRGPGLPPGAKPTFSSVLGGHTRQATTGRTAQSARRREPQRLRRRAAATSPAQKWLKLTQGSRRDGPGTTQTWRGARPPPLLLLLLQPLSVTVFKGLFAQDPLRFVFCSLSLTFFCRHAPFLSRPLFPRGNTT